MDKNKRVDNNTSKSFLSETANDLLRGPVMLGQAVGYGVSKLQEKSRAGSRETALRKARQKLSEEDPRSKGSAGRQSAEEQREKAAKELVRSGAVRSNSGTLDGRIQDMVRRDMEALRKKGK
jgi:hypothetical protein